MIAFQVCERDRSDRGKTVLGGQRCVFVERFTNNK